MVLCISSLIFTPHQQKSIYVMIIVITAVVLLVETGQVKCLLYIHLLYKQELKGNVKYRKVNFAFEVG
jgi:hypothetical protein